MSWQMQNKIDLKKVLWARETEQPPQTFIFTKTAGHTWAQDTVMWHTNDIMTKSDAVRQLMQVHCPSKMNVRLWHTTIQRLS